ncbi:MAG: DUF2749 domain-containing protein [Rhizobiaceae bacterium]|nr:DUF2749 domain-containing protein [Rhizobiaceae bacterium]
MKVIIMIIVAITIAIAATAMVWLKLSSPDEIASEKALREAPQQFDITSGQDLRPRWTEGEGAGHDVGYN